MGEKRRPLYKWLVRTLVLSFVLHVARSVLIFISYSNLEAKNVDTRDQIIKFFIEEWDSNPITNLHVTDENCPGEYASGRMWYGTA